MFKKTVFLALLSVAAICGTWLFKLIYISEADQKNYEIHRDQNRALAQVTRDQKTYQHRGGVRKDVWLAQEDKSRLHYRIDSKDSILTLLPVDDKVDIIENLNGIQCWMQDKFYAQNDQLMQQVRFFEAEKGIYQYSEGRFAAHTVMLSLFRLPGYELPVSLDPRRAFLRGIAQDVSFSIAGKTTQFQAERFKATLISAQEERP